MTIALLYAPVVYPWYLLCVTPFLFTTPTLPVMAWTFSVLPVYTVWHLARNGSRWTVPGWIVAVEFAVFAIATIALLRSLNQPTTSNVPKLTNAD